MPDLAFVHPLESMAPVEGRDCRVEPIVDAGVVSVQISRAKPAALEAVQAALPGLPDQVGQSAGSTPVIAKTGPFTWLVFTKRIDAPAMADKVAADCAGKGTFTAVDTTHRDVTLRLSGEGAAAELTRSVSLDLHPTVFVPGQCAYTGINGLRVLLLKENATDFLLVTDICAASAIWHWLTAPLAS